MEQLVKITEKIGLQGLIILAIAIVALIIVLILIHSVRLKKYRKKIAEIENRMNATKSLPIQYKLGRANNICMNVSDLHEEYLDLENEFHSIQEFQQNDLAILENEVDEQLFYGKLKKVSKKMKTLETLIVEYETRSQALLEKIEKITEVENVHRVKIIEVKDQFRKVQDHYQTVSNVIGEFVPNVSLSMNKIDQDFIRLEDLMNNQKFDDAGTFTEEIKTQIAQLNEQIKVLPDYVTVIKQYIPKKLNRFKQSIEDTPINLEKLGINQKVDEVEKHINSVVLLIKSLDLVDVADELEAIIKDIDGLEKEVDKEKESYEHFKKVWNNFQDVSTDVYKKYQAALKTYDQFNQDYVLDNQDVHILEQYNDYQSILADVEQIDKEVSANDFIYSDIVERINIIVEQSHIHYGYIQEFNDTAKELKIKEERCLSELENINIVLLEIKSEIKNRHLPMINESYKDYISDSYKKAAEIQELRSNKPVDLEVLITKTNEVRDVIYKLYDNVHNLCVTAQMVEEAVVFGNRYRSSFLEVNTELTKTEILFRNGEYTSALQTVVDIIEKIKPGSYEDLIKKGEKSV